MVFKLSAFFKNLPPKPVQTASKKTKKQQTLVTKPPPPPTPSHKKRKAPIPTALREAVWIHHMNRSFEGKCRVPWCPNTITVFDFQCGHNIPESKGGPTLITNLVPICSRCNQSMGDRYTITEWGELLQIPNVAEVVPPPKKYWCF
jgi:5-methylcytosine-specific restriction endonuclease McrA